MISCGAPNNHQSSVSYKKTIEAPVQVPEVVFNFRMLKIPNYKNPELKNSAPLTTLLLEFKAMHVERQCRIFIELWSDSIHILLWRNNGFLHSFRDFSKSNAFSKNLIRMKFISP